MIEQDTIKLLRECDAGIKMGVTSIEEVLPRVNSRQLEQILTDNKEKHETLDRRLQAMLGRYHDEGKDPNPMAKGMSWVKTNVMLAMKDSDATVAGLMVDGCDMGVKSLSRYLNQYKAADEESKTLTKDLIALEESLGKDLRGFL